MGERATRFDEWPHAQADRCAKHGGCDATKFDLSPYFYSELNSGRRRQALSLQVMASLNSLTAGKDRHPAPRREGVDA